MEIIQIGWGYAPCQNGFLRQSFAELRSNRQITSIKIHSKHCPAASVAAMGPSPGSRSKGRERERKHVDCSAVLDKQNIIWSTERVSPNARFTWLLIVQIHKRLCAFNLTRMPSHCLCIRIRYKESPIWKIIQSKSWRKLKRPRWIRVSSMHKTAFE